MGIGKVVGMTPAGGAYKGAKNVLGALGLGGLLGGVDHRARSLKALRKAIRKGDVAAIVRKAGSSKYVKVRGIAQAILAGAPDAKAAAAFYNATKAARRSQWGASSGPAPIAGQPSWPGQSPAQPLPTSGGPAPTRSARPKPPCAYGPRDPETGYCPKRPTRASLAGNGAGVPADYTQPVSRAARPKPPCKYGPRDEYGYCPPRPASSTTSRASAATRRRVETAVTQAITKGGKAGVAAAGGAAVVGGWLATAALVGAAGIAAYYITSKLRKLRFRTYDELRTAASLAYKESRRAAGEVNGTGLTPAQSAQLSQWYKQRIATINANEAAGVSLAHVYNLTFAE